MARNQRKESHENMITTRILRSLYDEVSEHVEGNPLYLNEVDFIRDACREKLTQLDGKKR